jgi:acyl transferase domain-containing protein
MNDHSPTADLRDSTMIRRTRGYGPPKVAFLFTGQGSTYSGMGRQLYETQPSYRATIDRCSEILAPLLDVPLVDVLFGERSAETLDRRDMRNRHSLPWNMRSQNSGGHGVSNRLSC